MLSLPFLIQLYCRPSVLCDDWHTSGAVYSGFGECHPQHYGENGIAEEKGRSLQDSRPTGSIQGPELGTSELA